MLLSITIASVSIRKEMLDNLLLELNKQIAENNSEQEVEILIDADDDRFLGTKRKLMLSQVKGLFTSAIDDDDLIFPNYIKLIIEAIKNDSSVDCLAINGIITTNGLNPKKWFISYRYEDWFEENDICLRYK